MCLHDRKNMHRRDRRESGSSATSWLGENPNHLQSHKENMSTQQRTRLALALAVGLVAAFVLAVSIRMVWAQFDTTPGPSPVVVVNPYEIDSDGDSMSDGLEEEWGTKPN